MTADTLVVQRRVLGPDHPDTLALMSNLQGHIPGSASVRRSSTDCEGSVTDSSPGAWREDTRHLPPGPGNGCTYTSNTLPPPST
jgi:hypothetical protein